LKLVFSQEFVTCKTCQTVGKILLENQLTANENCTAKVRKYC